MRNNLKKILAEIDEYCAIGETVEPTHVPRPEFVLDSTYKKLKAFEKELRERIMDISCGTKPNRTECWTIKEILGDV